MLANGLWDSLEGEGRGLEAGRGHADRLHVCVVSRFLRAHFHVDARCPCKKHALPHWLGKLKATKLCGFAGLIRAFDVLINTSKRSTSLTWEAVLLRKSSDKFLHGKVTETVREEGRDSRDHTAQSTGFRVG